MLNIRLAGLKQGFDTYPHGGSWLVSREIGDPIEVVKVLQKTAWDSWKVWSSQWLGRVEQIGYPRLMEE